MRNSRNVKIISCIIAAVLLSGAVYSSLPGSIDLDTAAYPSVSVLTGESNTRLFGYSLAEADMNGDNITDLIIGAQGDPSDNIPGKIYILYGRNTILPDTLLMDTIYDDVTVIEDTDRSRFFCEDIASGDVNNDGIDDLIITTNSGTSYQSPVRAYILYGNPSLISLRDISIADTTVQITGIKETLSARQAAHTPTYPGIGFRAVTGDVNGDGCDDIVLGAIKMHYYNPPYSFPDTTQGSVHVIFGSSELAALDTFNLDTDNYLHVEGKPIGDEFGETVAVSDLDNDGFAEIIIGAQHYAGGIMERGGQLYIIPGNDAFIFRDTIFTAEDKARFIPVYAHRHERLGRHLFTGDIDGDERGELIVSGFYYDFDGTGTSAFVLWSGLFPHMSDSVDLEIQTENITRIYGTDEDVQPAGDVAAGDFDGNGNTELFMGSPVSNRIQMVPGMALAGKPDSINVQNHPDIMTIANAGGKSFICMDLDGDGFDDLVTTDYAYNNLQGRVTVLYGSDGGTTGIKDERIDPKGFDMISNYPNPFNPETTIRYTMKEAGFVRIAVYNTLGQRVRALVAADMPAGEHRIVWDGRNDSGLQLGSGIYLVRMAAGNTVSSRKMLLVK